MSLPKVSTPTYSLSLPSSGEKIIFRPFTVRDEKILLMSADSDDEDQVRTLRQVINSCLLPNEKGKILDVGKLAMSDMDYVWLKIRSKSVDEVIRVPFECLQPIPEDKQFTDDNGELHDHCGTIVHVPINLDTIQVTINPENNPKIMIQDNIGIMMRFPTFETVQKLAAIKKVNDMQAMFEVIMECIEMIFDGEKTYEREHTEKKDLVEFLESLTQLQFAQITKFFETLPVLRHTVHFLCPKCKHEVDVVIEGTKSFFQ